MQAQIAPAMRTGVSRVLAALSLEPRVTRGGVAVSPADLGTTVTKVHVHGIRWQDTHAGVRVQAQVVVDVRWDVDPHGRIDVPSPWTSAVGPQTWEAVAGDLEPGSHGRPRRVRYWAEDLSVQHEKFHAAEDVDAAARALATATEWLEDQRVVPDDDNVAALLAEVQSHVKAGIETRYRHGGEERAYAAGRDLYAARAEAVRVRACAESWPGSTR